MNEAAFVLQDGVAAADEIDTIFKRCFGHRMGPLETADLIGSTVMHSLDVLYESSGTRVPLLSSVEGSWCTPPSGTQTRQRLFTRTRR